MIIVGNINLKDQNPKYREQWVINSIKTTYWVRIELQ